MKISIINTYKNINLIKGLLSFLRAKRIYRRLILICIDLSVLIFSFVIGIHVFNYEANISFLNYISILQLFIVLVIPFYVITGQYKGLSSYLGLSSFINICLRNFVLFLLVYFLGLILKQNIPKVSSFLISWYLVVSLSISLRLVLRYFLIKIKHDYKNIPKVVIYGAGEAGAQLAASLNLLKSHKVMCFVDDNSSLWERNINGIKIKNPNILKSKLLSTDQILLAMPSIKLNRRKTIINYLQKYNYKVFQVPSMQELAEGRVRINDLKPIIIEDLLKRESINIKLNNFKKEFKNKVVCITGGGGSIGSELGKQLLKYNLKSIIILENHEPSLYEINMNLTQINSKKTLIKPILCDLKNYDFLLSIFKEYKVDIVFHTAAYKHVPLVELNPLQGMANNIISSKNICDASLKNNVENLILISSDKAVRPTNIMGATKRLSEIIFQAYANKFPKPIFSMVRFGNVLGSSGSVVPLFKKQIENGGPITITNYEIVRYFMTITEAVQLVIQTVLLAKSGDVFLLDMGKPVRIYDLAIKMIKLSGLSIKDENKPDGDIEIVSTGLREGEKLFEELLISAESEETKHPLIFKAREKFIPYDELILDLNILEKTFKDNNLDKSIPLLNKLVPEWENNLKK